MSEASTRKRAVIYLRVANVEPPKYGRPDTARQRTACQEAAAVLGADIVGEYIELGASGTSTKRPMLSKLLDDVARNQDVDYVIVADMARWSRLRGLGQALNYQLASAGCELVVADEMSAPPIKVSGAR